MTRLSDRPGWSQLRRAVDDLHAAELLIADPVAPPRTAVPHLREFWQGMVAVGQAAELGKAGAREPHEWLEGELPELSARQRTALQEHWRTIAAAEDPSRAQLRAHLEAARELVIRVEPIVGGPALRTRRRRLLWTSVGVTILLAPIAIYTALHTEVEGDGPWRASYYTDRELETTPIVLRELSVVHDWGRKAPHEAVPPEQFSARWDTCLRIDEAGPVTFQVNANDGARVIVGGETIIDAWDRDPVTRKRGFGTAVIDLDAGVHHLRVEYFQGLAIASIRLAASFDDQLPSPIPNERLSYPGDELDEGDPCL